MGEALCPNIMVILINVMQSILAMEQISYLMPIRIDRINGLKSSILPAPWSRHFSSFSEGTHVCKDVCMEVTDSQSEHQRTVHT